MVDLARVTEVMEVVTTTSDDIERLNKFLADGWVLLRVNDGVTVHAEGDRQPFFEYSLGWLEEDEEPAPVPAKARELL